MSNGGPRASPRVIVADDEAIIRELVRSVLVREGFDVMEAADGHEAVALLEASEVDLLISDILMPGLNGLETVDVAREISPRTSSIVMTGATSLETARMAAQRGACDYLPKPFSESDLVDAVNRALTRRSQELDIARQRELEELFKLSEGVSTSNDPWEMLRLTSTAARIQTSSDVGCFAALRDGKLWPLLMGAFTPRGACEPLTDDDPMAIAAQQQAPILLTSREAHPLAHVLGDVRAPCAFALGPAAEALVFPVVAGNEVGGAIAMGRHDDDRPYNRGDFKLLSVLAGQCGLLLKNAELVESLQQAYVGTIHSMARMVEARDTYTHGHSRRVADLCRRIAEKMEVDPRDADTLEMAAGLHDIGKVAVPDAVLNKPGKLTEDEWRSIRLHPVVGAQVLAPATFLADASPLVRHHHERYDGTGYPDHMGVAELSPLTHIIIAADAWDAMTSNRSYRPSLTEAQALSEIGQGRGSQFHPEVADALVSVLSPAA